jgi:hypothetical protein
VHYRPAGRTAVGLHADAAMSQVWSALRAYVALDPDPLVVITRLSTMF